MSDINRFYLCIYILSATSCAQNNAINHKKAEPAPAKVVVPLKPPENPKKELKKTIVWHKESAAKANAEADFSLGNLFQAIVGNIQYSKESVKSFKKAAKQGHAGAQNMLAMRYYLGNGVRKNIPKALKLYEEAGRNGNIYAIHNLGRIYAKGTAVKADNITAYKWLDLARFYTLYSNNMRLKTSIHSEIDELEKVMSKQQINDAKNQAKQWLDNLQNNKRYNNQGTIFSSLY